MGGRKPPPAAAEDDPYAAPPRMSAPARQEGGGRGVRNRPEVLHAQQPNSPPPEKHSPPPRQPRQERNISQASQEPEPAAPYNNYVARDVDTEILVEKEQTINELRETVDVSSTLVPARL